MAMVTGRRLEQPRLKDGLETQRIEFVSHESSLVPRGLMWFNVAWNSKKWAIIFMNSKGCFSLFVSVECWKDTKKFLTFSASKLERPATCHSHARAKLDLRLCRWTIPTVSKLFNLQAMRRDKPKKFHQFYSLRNLRNSKEFEGIYPLVI